ncbi:MAG: VOC family protein [Alphaproteobacteria bacterium]
MEKVTAFGGVFFRARDPEALSTWYATHLGVDGPPWFQDGGPAVFAPFAADTDYFGRPEQQWMINFRVSDLNAMITQLEAAGIAVETRPDEWDSEVGRFARIHDPEGNPIELWEMPASL